MGWYGWVSVGALVQYGWVGVGGLLMVCWCRWVGLVWLNAYTVGCGVLATIEQ